MVQRIIATITLGIFITTQAASAAPDIFLPALEPREVSLPELEIRIPAELGEIRDQFTSRTGSPSVVLHIEDAHGNVEAQHNIERLLEHLETREGVRLVFLEGGAGELNPSLFRFFADEALNARIAEPLIAGGHLGGAERFLIRSRSARGFGVEDVASYRKDIELFRRVLGSKPEEFIRAASSSGDLAANRLLNKELKDFVREWRSFEENGSSLYRFISALDVQAKKAATDLRDPRNQESFGGLVRILNMKELEKELDRPRALKEMEKFAAELEKAGVSTESARRFREIEKEKLPRFTVEKILEETGGKTDFAAYPALKTYLLHAIFRSEVDPAGVLLEIRRLTKKMFRAAAKSSAEKDAVRLLEDLSLLKRLFDLEISRPEYKKILSHPERFAPGKIEERVRALVPDEKIAFEGAAVKKADGIYRDALDFYRLAVEREKHFLENAFRAMRDEKETRSVIVTGGFHSGGLKKELRARGISYVRIAPRITAPEDGRKTYVEAMTGASTSHISNVAELIRLDLQEEMGAFVSERVPEIFASVFEAVREAGKETGAPLSPAETFAAIAASDFVRENRLSFITAEAAPGTRTYRILFNGRALTDAGGTPLRLDVPAGDQREAAPAVSFPSLAVLKAASLGTEAPSGALPAGDSYPNVHPKSQFVDLYSRFGVWQAPESRKLGLDHGAMASQRTGKFSFLNPLLHIGVRDEDGGQTFFLEDTDHPRNITWHPWGFVETREINKIKVVVTVVYAARDTIQVKVDIENGAPQTRNLAPVFRSKMVPEDTEKSVEVDSATNLITLQQTSKPTELRWQMRPEPDFEIVTAIRPSFELARADVSAKQDGYEAAGRPIAVPAGGKQEVTFTISSNAKDKGNPFPLRETVKANASSVTAPAGAVIAAAQDRWEAFFESLPKNVPPQYQGLLQHAALVLMRNSIDAQATYGSAMNGYTGTLPNRGFYEAFWIWDSAFQAAAFQHWDMKLAKDNILLMLHNQQPDGGIAVFYPDSAANGNHGQPPLFTWVAMQIYARDGDTAFLNELYPKLARWNTWWFENRDQNGNGLAAWESGEESGMDNSPRWKDEQGRHTAGHLEAVDLNSYLYLDMKMLAKMAREIGRNDEAAEWELRADELGQKIVDHLYDPEDNLFWDARFNGTGYVPNKVLTPVNFLPLWVGVPLEPKLARAMIEEYLVNPDVFFGEYPFPTVAYHEKSYEPGFYWRGPVWLNMAYFMIDLLHQHGYEVEAQQARTRLLDMVNRHPHIYEYYNSQTGNPGEGPANAVPPIPAAQDFSWSAAFAILMMLNQFGAVSTTGVTDTSPPTSPRSHVQNRLAAMFGVPEPAATLTVGVLAPAASEKAAEKKYAIIDKLTRHEQARRELVNDPGRAHKAADLIEQIRARAPPKPAGQPWLNVAEVHFTYPPHVSGVDILMGKQAEWLVQHGMRVKGIAGNPGGFVQPPHMSYVHVPEMAGMKADHPITANAVAGNITGEYQELRETLYQRLTEEFKDQDVIVIHNVMTVRLNLPLTEALHRIIRENPHKHFVIYTHNVEDQPHGAYPLNMLNLNWTFPHVSHVTVSEFYRHTLAGQYGLPQDQIHILNPGFESFSPLDMPAEAVRHFEEKGLFEADHVLVFPTRVDWNKDLPKAIYVADAMRRKGSNTKLALLMPNIGSVDDLIAAYEAIPFWGREKADWVRANRDMVENAVAFFNTSLVTGFEKNRRYIMGIIAMADASLITSKMETFGMPAVETASVGTVVAATDLPPHQNTLEGRGVLFHMTDPSEEIADRILARPNYLEQRALRIHAHERYLWDSLMTHQFLPLLLSAYERRPLQTRAVSELEKGPLHQDEAFNMMMEGLRVVNTVPEAAAQYLNDLNGARRIIAAFRDRMPDFTHVTHALELLISRLQTQNVQAQGLNASNRELLRQVVRATGVLLYEDSRNTEALNHLGHVFAQYQRFEDARGLYSRVLTNLDGKNTDALNGLGNIYAQQGMVQEAAEQFQKVLTIDPNNVYAREYLRTVQGQSLGGEQADFTLRLVTDSGAARWNVPETLRDLNELVSASAAVSRYSLLTGRAAPEYVTQAARLAARVLYLPGASKVVFEWYAGRMDLEPAAAPVQGQAAFDAFRADPSILMNYLGGQVSEWDAAPSSSEGSFPFILTHEILVRQGEDPRDTASRFLQSLRSGDGVLAVWNAASEKGMKPKVIGELYHQGSGRGVKIRDLMQELLSPAQIRDFTKDFSVSSISVTSLPDFEVKAADGEVVQLKIEELAGIDPVAVLGLLRELAEAPGNVRHKVFKAAGFSQDANGRWIVGAAFAQLLTDLYTERAAAQLTAQAA